jgi:hypothetical protein
MTARRVARQEHREHRWPPPGKHDPAAVGGGHRPGKCQAEPGPLGPLTDRSKILETSSAGTPSPSSSTSITTELADCDRRIVTVPLPCISALSNRVAMTWASPPGVT